MKNDNAKLKILIITALMFLGFFCFAKVSQAATITAASCSQQDVQVSIDQAQDGDTVLVPEGSCTWTTTKANTPSVTIPNTKGIIFKGAGIDKTTITDGTGTAWNEKPLSIIGAEGKPFRVTEFTFVGFSGTGNSESIIGIGGTSKNFRIDHCKFTNSIFQSAVSTWGYIYGVVDHCTFFNTRILVSGDDSDSWKRPLSLGTENAIYVEDSNFEATVHSNTIDAFRGGRYVFRYNTVKNSSSECHSGCPNGYRGTFSYEIYNNTFTATRTIWSPFFQRAGTGAIFNNIISGNYTDPSIQIDNQRSCKTDCIGYWSGENSLCDGDSIYDGNTPGMNGYPCRDQIGRSTDSGITTPQALEPLYEWNNTYNGKDVDIKVHGYTDCPIMADHIRENRDFFNDTPRPNYTPYTYPHPLTLAGETPPDTIPPAAPTGLQVN